jgi:hypothetical protein
MNRPTDYFVPRVPAFFNYECIFSCRAWAATPSAAVTVSSNCRTQATVKVQDPPGHVCHTRR